MIPLRTILPVLLILVFRSTLPTEATPINVEDPDVCNTEACHESAQSLQDSMDTSADPCQDFYRYACGGWIDKHPIPDDKTEYSTLDITMALVSERVSDLLRTAANEIHVKPIGQAAALFAGCMDEDARETQGLEPLKNFLNSVGGWPMISPQWSDVGYQWQEQVAKAIRTVATGIIVNLRVEADAMESSRHIFNLDQASFGFGRNQLLNRNSSEQNVEFIEGYKNYMVQVAKLFNPDADEAELIRDAQDVIDFESGLAQFSKPPEEKKDPESWYHKMSVVEADTVTENTYFQWKDFLNAVLHDYPKANDETDVIVADIDFLKNALKLTNATSARTVANYIGWILVKTLGDQTTKGFRQTSFNFQSMMSGVEKPPKLERDCSENVIQLFSFAVGRLYVDKYFSAEEKRDVEAILEDIRSTYEFTLNHNPWIDPDTKSRALEKLRSITKMVAYPEWIKNDQELVAYYRSVPSLNEEEYFASLMKTVKSVTGFSLKKWNQPTHKTTEWISPPSEVNAFYYPSANTITFPSGILNLPVYKYGRSLALNYGALGSIIGHEISHGFDDQGSQYDKEGDLVDWWTKETKDQFHSKSTCFRRQYSSYVEPITNTRLNGNLTIGDDIADNGGIRNAFLAYQLHVMDSDDQIQQTAVSTERLPGIAATPEQLFFLGYAAMYCWHERSETLGWTIENSDHTVLKYRVIIPLSNSRDFAEAFNCTAGSPMNPESKCVLW